MTVAVVADAHLGGPGGSPDLLITQLDALADEGIRRLVLLGDLFQVWVGYPAFETPDVRQLLGAVDRLRAAGIRVDYIEGNRDFFVAAGPYRNRFDDVGLECAFAAGGTRYLAVHGDGLNDRDRQYLAWRWLSKSPPVRAVVRRMPAGWVRRMVLRTERQLSGTNFKHRSQVPEAAIRAYAERRLAEGHDVLLLGHFHEPARFAVPGGEVRLLDAWFRGRRVERFGVPSPP
jgi:UDP-2,3-diacylglucosamine hydrolase